MVRAALAGKLDGVPVKTDPVFGLAVPTAIDGVPAAVLDARSTWKDRRPYDERQAAKLGRLFREKHQKEVRRCVSDKILRGGPTGTQG